MMMALLTLKSRLKSFFEKHVVAVILGCLPGSVRALVFQVVNLHLDVLVEGSQASSSIRL